MSDQEPVVPWAAPGGQSEPGSVAPAVEGARLEVEPGSTYRPSWTRSRWAAGLIAASIIGTALDGVLSIYGIVLLSDLANVTEDQLNAFYSMVGLVAIGTLVTLIGGAIAYWAWLHRVVSNVPALGGGTPEVTPGWAVGWWFIPFANFVKPYRIVSDLWRRLATSPAGVPTGMVLAWWLTYLSGSLLGNLYARLPAPETVDEFNGQMLFSALGDVVVFISGVLAIRVILEIESRSRARARAIAAQPPEIPAVAVAAVLEAGPLPADAGSAS